MLSSVGTQSRRGAERASSKQAPGQERGRCLEVPIQSRALHDHAQGGLVHVAHGQEHKRRDDLFLQDLLVAVVHNDVRSVAMAIQPGLILCALPQAGDVARGWL